MLSALLFVAGLTLALWSFTGWAKSGFPLGPRRPPWHGQEFLIFMVMGIGFMVSSLFRALSHAPIEPRDRWAFIPTGRWKRMNLAAALRTRIRVSETRTVSVKVVDVFGTGLPNVDVVLEITELRSVFRATGRTDVNGTTVFVGVPAGGRGRVSAARSGAPEPDGGAEANFDGEATSAQVSIQ